MNLIYSWSFSNKKNRWKMWYIIAFSIAIWLIIWGALNRMYIMSFVIILLSWVYFFVENNSDDDTEVKLFETWIEIWGSFYDYSRVNWYSIVYRQNAPVILRIRIKLKTLNSLDIPINAQILNDISDWLPYVMTQEDEEETTFIEDVINYLKI